MAGESYASNPATARPRPESRENANVRVGIGMVDTMHFLDHLHAVQSAKSADEAFAAGAAYFQGLGFINPYIAYGTTEPDPDKLHGLRFTGVEVFRGTEQGRLDGFYSWWSDKGHHITCPGSRPFWFGNTRPFRMGSPLNQHLCRDDRPSGQNSDLIYRRPDDLQDYFGGRQQWIIPLMTPLADDIPIASLNLNGNFQDTELAKVEEDLLQSASVMAFAIGQKYTGTFKRIAENIPPLSTRERECLTWVAAGLRPVAIAHKLEISKTTVDTYLLQARTKLKAKSIAQATAKAVLYGEIQP